MKVLITGATGQLGHALMATASPDVTVAALSRAELDLGDRSAIHHVVEQLRPDVIFNAAAYTAVDKAEAEPEAAYAINRDAPAALAEAAGKVGARLVHVSTDFVFGDGTGVPYSPEAEPRPLSIYGASKLAGEIAVRDRLADALIVRTAWVYSVHGRNFVKTMLRLMAEQPEVRVVADQVGTPTHAASLAQALWTLVHQGAAGTHHFTDAGVASWYDFAVAIQEEALTLGLLERSVPVRPIQTADFPTPARRPSYSVLDKTSCWKLLGSPAQHWRAELRGMLSQLKVVGNG